MCEVVNKYTDSYDIDITRPSKWSNPYSHKENTLAQFKVDNRKQAIVLFEKYLLNNEDLLNSLSELKYKRLGCVCKTNTTPNELCHGDILKKYVDRLEVIDRRKDFFD